MSFCFFFFFTDTATTELYTSLHTRSLHDALPLTRGASGRSWPGARRACPAGRADGARRSEEHTSELQSRNDSSYAVCCLKNKKKNTKKKKKRERMQKKKKKKTK